MEEIPVFVRLHQQQKDLHLIGVSLDEASDQGKVQRFVNEHHMSYSIFLRAGTNFENMVNAMDPQWIGAIPATFVFKKGKRTFSKVGPITEPELTAAIR